MQRACHTTPSATAAMAGSRICSAENFFLFINIAFAMYSGTLLSTAARLSWEPSTYIWLHCLFPAQNRVVTGCMLVAGLWLCALVYVAVCAVRAERGAGRVATLRLYVAGLAALAASEAAFGAWLASSLLEWWRAAPMADLARRGIKFLYNLKPPLLFGTRFLNVARRMLDMIEELEREVPKNVYVVVVFVIFGIILQVSAVVLATQLARGATRERAADSCCEKCAPADDDSDALPPPASWHKHANLRVTHCASKPALPVPPSLPPKSPAPQLSQPRGGTLQLQAVAAARALARAPHCTFSRAPPALLHHH